MQGHYVVGNTGTSGFLYNDVSKTYSTFQYPAFKARKRHLQQLIVGTYNDAAIAELEHGYIYNTLTHSFVALDDPSAATMGGFSGRAGVYNGTYANGINGNNVVGSTLIRPAVSTAFCTTSPPRATARSITRGQPAPAWPASRATTSSGTSRR